MKILHSVFSLDPTMGGPSKACLEMCLALAANGHEITIMTTDYFQTKDDKEAFIAQTKSYPDNLKILWFPTLVIMRGLAFSLPMVKELKRQIPLHDLVHIHSIYLFHSLFSGYFARKTEIPYIIRPHGTLDPFLFQRKRWRKWLMETAFQNHNFKNAAAIHYTTAEEMELASPHTFGAPGIVIPNGLNVGDYANLPAKGSFRDKYPETIGKKIILFFSRINFKKGLDILTPAFIKLAKKHPDYHLALVGPDDSNLVPGILRELNQAGLATEGTNKRITITGMIGGNYKLAALNDADVFVLPSYSENFGIAVIEAMICGLPVIISNKVNIWREVVADGAGITGPCDIDWFANAIEYMLQNPRQCHEMGQAGIKSVKQRYSWEQIAVQLENAYAEIIARHKRKRP